MAKDMGVEYVIESTGLFVEAEKVLFFKKIILLMAIVFAEHVHTGSPNFFFFEGCVCFCQFVNLGYVRTRGYPRFFSSTNLENG